MALRVLAGGPYVTIIVDGDGQITWVGGNLEGLTGYQEADLIGTNMLDHIDIDWNPLALDSVMYAMGHPGVRRPMLFRARRKDGSYFISEVTANSQMEDPVVGGLIVYLRRWDGQYLMDQVIERLASGDPVEDVFDLLVQVIAAETLEAEGAIFWERADNHFDRVIQASSLGLTLGNDVIGSPWEKCVSSGEPTWASIEEVAGPLRAEAVGAGYLGIWCWPVIIQDQTAGCIVLWRRSDEEPDFTCRMVLGSLVRVMQLMLEREITRRHVRSQEVLASLGTLTAGVAHEIRNPLSFVQTFAGGAAETVADLKDELGRSGGTAAASDMADDLAESLDLIEKHAFRIESIASSMLGYSRGRSTDPELVDVADLTKTFADLGYEGFRAAGHGDFTANFVVSAPDSAMAAVYPEEIGRVVVNLVNNACAAAEEMAAQDERRPEVAVTVSHTSDEVRIEVRDNGTGIPEEARERIFEPFFTTKPPGEGTGIGLDVCRDIVMGLHRGDLQVDSEVGVGTTFAVVLPVSSLPNPVGMNDPDIADGPDLAVGI